MYDMKIATIPKYTRYLGWDCANKSLAHALVTINESAINMCDELDCSGFTDSFTDSFTENIVKLLILRSYLRVESIAVKDLLPGLLVANVSEIARMTLLAKYLTEVAYMYSVDSGVQVIIEHQPANMTLNNDKSAAIANGIAMFFILRGNPVAFISPRAKNAMIIGGHQLRNDPEMTSAQKYRARKSHTVAMMHHLSKQFAFEDQVRTLPRDCLDDAADALIQIFAYRQKCISTPTRGGSGKRAANNTIRKTRKCTPLITD